MGKPHHVPVGTPISTRLLSLTLAIFPLVLLLTAFVLAAVSSAQNDWSFRDLYDPAADDIVYIGTEHRSPFVNCALGSSTANVTAADNSTTEQTVWAPVCVSSHQTGGLCDPTAQGASRADSAFFCQHLSLSAHLLYAGCALLGSALLLVLVLTAATVPQVLRTGAVHIASSSSFLWARHHRKGQTYVVPPNHSVASYLALLLTLLAALGALTLAAGVVTGINALSVLQFPNGDYFSTGLTGSGDPTEFNHGGPWMLGRSAGICAAGAVLAAVASYFVGLVWEGPRVGVVETHEPELVDNAVAK